MPIAELAFAIALGLGARQAQTVQIAPFTQVEITGAETLNSEGGTAAPGTLGAGIDATQPVVLSGLKLNPVEGLIEVWVKPLWPGNDGRNHVLWKTNVAAGRQLSLEKSDLGMLRAVLKTPNSVTVSRTDASGWKAGVWHQVVVGWTSHNGMNVGLPLWVDKVAVDGQITAHGVFDPAAMPTKLTFGDADFDELIVRPNLNAEGNYGMIGCVYRDFFRTAPFSAIKVDNEPTRVPSDPRAIDGYSKQFGLFGDNQGTWQPTVENVVRYSQWAYFDARHLIKWSSSDPSIATIDDEGKAKGINVGKCEIKAEFHGLIATYPLTVISPDKPDLDAICIEMTPRFRSDAVRDRPQPGEEMTAKVHIGNFGLAPLAAGAKARFSLVPRQPHNFRFDPSLKPVKVFEETLPALAPNQETTFDVQFPFPAQSTWMHVELDPEGKVDDLCRANNDIEELTDARPEHMGYNPKNSHAEYDNRVLNHVGSFSYYDWIRGEKRRMDVMLHDAIYPGITPYGVEEGFRIDKFTPLQGGNWDDEPFNKEAVWYDGGFPLNEPVDLGAIDCAIIHEFGHVVLSQPDLYGYVTSATNVFVTDDDGKLVSGTPALPVVSGDSNLPSAPAQNIPCGGGYPSLMDGCQLWFPPSMAGHVMYYRGYRGDRFWGTQGRLIPTRANWLMITDANDHPLKNAAVYVYHVSQAPVQDSGAKYFANRPKFMGQTDDEGRYIFPIETDQDWDDPTTDKVDGSVSVWNPFGTASTDTAFTPNVWSVEGLLLIRVVSGKESEYRFMDLTQFNTEFLAGNEVCGKYYLRTSLDPTSEPTPVVRKPIPDAIRTANKAPVAVAPKEMTVKCGEEFTIDGSKSFDPEGQPLIYRWNVGEGWLRGSVSQTSKMTLKAPDKPQDLSYKFWVMDGVRCSEAVTITVHVVK